MSDFNDRPMRIVLADHQPIFRTGLKAILETLPRPALTVQAGTAEERLQLLHNLKPDLLITDLMTPAGDHSTGLQMLADIRLAFPALPVLVVTSITDGELLRAILRHRVQGLMSKISAAEDLPAAVAGLGRNRVYIGNSARNAMLDALEKARARPKTLEQLSPREQEVMRFFAAGLSVGKIAEQLNRSKQTVSAQKISAMRKLRLTSDIALLVYLKNKP